MLVHCQSERALTCSLLYVVAGASCHLLVPRSTLLLLRIRSAPPGYVREKGTGSSVEEGRPLCPAEFRPQLTACPLYANEHRTAAYFSSRNTFSCPEAKRSFGHSASQIGSLLRRVPSTTLVLCIYGTADLRFAGLQSPLDAPHHVRRSEWLPYREGVVVAVAESPRTACDEFLTGPEKKKLEKDGGAWIDCGLPGKVWVSEKELADNMRWVPWQLAYALTAWMERSLSFFVLKFRNECGGESADGKF